MKCHTCNKIYGIVEGQIVNLSHCGANNVSFNKMVQRTCFCGHAEVVSMGQVVPARHGCGSHGNYLWIVVGLQMQQEKKPKVPEPEKDEEKKDEDEKGSEDFDKVEKAANDNSLTIGDSEKANKTDTTKRDITQYSVTDFKVMTVKQLQDFAKDHKIKVKLGQRRKDLALNIWDLWSSMNKDKDENDKNL